MLSTEALKDPEKDAATASQKSQKETEKNSLNSKIKSENNYRLLSLKTAIKKCKKTNLGGVEKRCFYVLFIYFLTFFCFAK